ncbi:MAG: NAD(P)-dependent oxidoreductase [Bacteroidota bacterium]|nr:NAD(P)-dependent oxidoreductase [Bacteroidota bacterium]
MKIGVLREGKVPHDKRVAFTPDQCIMIGNNFQGVEIVVQPSDWRGYTNEEYRSKGVKMQEDMNDCDILIGIKEVPKNELIPNKKYLFFSHTIKKQPHNKELLQTILKNNIQLIDYECLTDSEFNRIIGFGHYAGIVGTYNGILGYGKKYNLFDLKPAHLCHDRKELREELKKIHLTNLKIIVTGNGRVANGAIELLGALGIRRITPYEFSHYSYREPTYAQLHSNNYNEANDGSAWNTSEFYAHPEKFRSTFGRYINYCDLLIHCSFWNPSAPVLFTKKEMRSPEFRISVIADVTCDINGSIPSTTRSTTIDDKFYGYNPVTESIGDPWSNDTITVMAVDNLPCELPRDASDDFGKELIEKVLPSLLTKDEDGLIERGSITRDGKLMPRFEYLQDYIAG